MSPHRPHSRRLRPSVPLALAALALLAPATALAWWTTEPDGTPVWLHASPGSMNDHGYQAAATIDLLAAVRSRAAPEALANREAFLYGAWAEDYVTGGTLADHLYAAGHHWDGGDGAPALAQTWFDIAVGQRRLGLVSLAWESLGRALHYAQDVTHGLHAFSPADPDLSGVFCLHQPWYGFDDYRSHCHSVVELRVAGGSYPIAPSAVPSFKRAKEPGRAATTWARKVHGKNEAEIERSVRAWHDAVRRGDWGAIDARIPDLFERAAAAGAGLVEAFAARAGI